MAGIAAAGIYPTDAETYNNATGALGRALRSSTAKTLLMRTPLHAWTETPGLNPDWQPRHSANFDFGKGAHAMLLGKGDTIRRVLADSWRTNAAKAVRDEARAAGETPMLAEEYDVAVRMFMVARRFLDDAGIGALDPERSEMMAVADIDGVSCRMMADHVPEWPTSPIIDYKTAQSVSDRGIQNAITAYGYDISEQWYREVWRAATGEDRDFLLIFQEKEPPFACRLVQLLRRPGDDADWSEDAAEKCAEARRIWRRCLETGQWPVYPAKRWVVGAPRWHRSAWTETQTIAPEGPSRETLARATTWQSPSGMAVE